MTKTVRGAKHKGSSSRPSLLPGAPARVFYTVLTTCIHTERARQTTRACTRIRECKYALRRKKKLGEKLGAFVLDGDMQAFFADERTCWGMR